MILLIDTATEKTAIGLAKEGRLLAHRIWTSQQNQSQELLPEIDKLLKKTKSSPQALQSVVVNTGPGSFTGLRVGLSVANAFSFALNIPVIGVSRFELAAKNFGRKKTTFQIPARADEYYTAPVENFKLKGKPHITKKIKGAILPSGNKLSELRALLFLGQERTKKKQGFTTALLPLYVRPPHITKSKKA